MFDAPVAFWAKTKPHAFAITTSLASITYAQFDRDIDRFAAAFRAFDLPSEGLVGVQQRNPYAHWLAAMALSRLGIASASIPSGEASAQDILSLLRPDLLLADAATAAPCRVVLLSAEWIEATLRKDAGASAAIAVNPDAVGRVTTSSGTTGRRKPIPFTWRKIIERAQFRAATDRGRDDTVLVMAGNDTTHGFSNRIATWIAGATLLLGPDARQLPAALIALRPTLLALSPGHLQMLVEALPDDFRAIPRLRVRVGGGRLSPSLARRARLALTPDIQIAYSSTEAGSVAMGPASLLDASPGSVGYRLPGVEIEALAPDGTPCPPGVPGELRISGPELVSGYRDDDAQTARSFRGGWFHPGDIGTVMPDGELRIHGRIDDLMNFGGLKLLPGAVEDVLQTSSGVTDIAVFSVPADGVDTLWAAVVRGDGFDRTELTTRLHQAMPRLPALQIALTEAIPRTGHGKVDVRELRRWVASPQPAAP